MGHDARARPTRGRSPCRYCGGVSQQYPEDEFDRAGADMPIGVHRKPASRWRSVLPFVLVLLLVPLAAWGATSFMTRDRASGDGTPTTSAQSAGATSAAQTTSSAPRTSSARPTTTSATPSPSPTTTTAAPVDYNVKISVLNGTRTAGLAARRVAQLRTAGFNGVSAGNAQNWATQVSTVYYRDPSLVASAQKVASTLAIASVRQSTSATGTSDIVVLVKQ